MKTLRIIVLKDSAIDSYLSNVGFIYDKVVHLSDIVCYKMNISNSLQLIDFLVCKFCIKDFSVDCLNGEVFFRVRSLNYYV